MKPYYQPAFLPFCFDVAKDPVMCTAGRAKGYLHWVIIVSDSTVAVAHLRCDRWKKSHVINIAKTMTSYQLPCSATLENFDKAFCEARSVETQRQCDVYNSRIQVGAK